MKSDLKGMIIMTEDEILKILYEKHGVCIPCTQEIKILIRYVWHIAYGQAWRDKTEANND